MLQLWAFNLCFLDAGWKQLIDVSSGGRPLWGQWKLCWWIQFGPPCFHPKILGKMFTHFDEYFPNGLGQSTTWTQVCLVLLLVCRRMARGQLSPTSNPTWHRSAAICCVPAAWFVLVYVVPCLKLLWMPEGGPSTNQVVRFARHKIKYFSHHFLDLVLSFM